MSTISYQPTHQPSAPAHVFLPRLAPARAVQREEARRQRSAHTEEGYKKERRKRRSREGTSERSIVHTHTQAKVGLMCQGYGSVQKMSRGGGRSNDDFSKEASVHI